MKKLKHILAISAIALMAVVFMPMLQGSDGQASAAGVAWKQIGSSDCKYKIETTGTGESQEVTLTIAPDNDTSGTLPDDCEFAKLGGVTADKITKVVIREGVKPGNSTASMFSDLGECKEIQGISNPTFDTSNVEGMGYMFQDCYSLTSLDLSNFNTANVTTMDYMFWGCQELTSLDLSNFNTTSVQWMNWMFRNCSKLTTLDLSSFNTTSVKDMNSMFNSCSNLTTILVGSGWNTTNVTEKSSAYMFLDCTSIKGGAGTTYDSNHIDKTYACIDGGTGSETPGYLTKSPIYVDAESTAEKPDGTAKKPYKTIQAAIDAAKTTPATIKMLSDITENVTISNGHVDEDASKEPREGYTGAQSITLDLNGHVLEGTGSGSVISNHGTLTIKDGKTEAAHYFTYKKNEAWMLNTTATEDQKNNATLLKDIDDSTADGTLIKICGGVITGGNVSNSGGGILTYVNSNLTMTGGTVCGNKADSDGGGIYTAAGVSVTLQNATIIGNHAKTQAGGVMLNAYNHGSLNVGGTVNISGNTAGTDTVTDDNLTLWVPQTYDGPITIKQLSTESKIHVSLANGQSTGKFTTNGTAENAKYFTSDNDKYYVKHVSGENQHLELAALNVKIADGIQNGTVTVSDQGATTGDNVTVTATPSEGYELDQITVKDKDDNDITEPALSGTTITMPAVDKLPITVSATFKKSEPTFDDRFGGAVTKENYRTWTHDPYTLDGWYYDNAGTSTKLVGDAKNGVTYTAKWITAGGKTVITQPLDFTSMETTDKSDDQGWKWDNESKTLTLNGATVDVYGDEKAESSANTQAVILLPDRAKVIATDGTENTINLNSTTTNEYAFAIESRGTLAISGKGTLNVNAEKASDESNVRVYGISTSGKLSINELTLNVFGQDKAIYKGDANQDNIEISGGTINAKCNTADGDVTVEDNGKYAIHAEKGDIVISNGTVNAKGGAIGIIASLGKVAVSDGTVTVDSGTHGLHANTSVDITGGTVKATAHGYVEGQEVKSAKAIYSQGTIGISGTANVSATCINDMDVTVDGAKFYGIRAKDNITITGTNAVITAKGTTAAFNLESDKTVTATGAVIRAGDNEESASVQTGDVTAAVTGNNYAKISWEPVFDDRFGGINLTKDSYTIGKVPTTDCHAKTQGYTFAGWSTVIDDESKIISTEPENGKTYYAVWKHSTTNKFVVTEPLDLNRTLPETDKLEKYGYKYEAASTSGSTLELTLDGFTMDVCDVSGNNNAAMQINRNTEISLSGSNNIYVDSNGNGATGIYADEAETSASDKVIVKKKTDSDVGKLNITTEASGEAMTGLSGMHINGSALEIKDVTVNAKTGEVKASTPNINCYGILVNSKNSDALIISGAKVKAEAGDSTGGSCGIYVKADDNSGNISISNDAEVTVTSGNAAIDSIAMQACGKLAVENSTVKAIDLLKQGIISTGGNIEINNSVVNAKYAESTSFGEKEDLGKEGYGIYAQQGNINIKGTATNVNVKGGMIGIIAKGDQTNQGCINIENGDIAVDVAKEGLWAKTKLNIEAGKVSAIAHGSTASGGAKAIYSQGTINIGSADVTAQCVDTTLTTEKPRYGIRAKDNVTVTSPEKLIVKGATAAFNIKGTEDKDLISDIDLTAYTDVEGTQGKATLTPAADTGIIDLNGDTYKCVRTKEAEPTPTPTPSTKYTVTFDNQGHGIAPQSQRIEKGGKVSDPGSLKEDGYVFGGWFADKACTDAWDFDNDTVTKSMTLYAKWTDKTAIENCEIVLSNEVYVFNNKVQIPNVTLTDLEGNILEEDKDYTFELEDSKNVGTYAVTVNGIGVYKGSAQASYKINPAPKAIKTVNAGKKKLTVKWKKSSKTYRAQTTGYQIKVSSSKKFKKSRTVYAKARYTAKTIKKLRAHKKYYVKMRTYKVVDGQKYYSTWSKVKAKKTR